MSADLTRALGLAYAATVMGRGSSQAAFNLFQEHAAEPEFLAAAKAELDRAKRNTQRCFLSKQNAAFLTEAFALLKDRDNATVL